MKTLYLFALLASGFAATGQQRLIFKVVSKLPGQNQESPLSDIRIQLNFEGRQEIGFTGSDGQKMVALRPGEERGDPVDYAVSGAGFVGKSGKVNIGKNDRENTVTILLEPVAKPPVFISKPTDRSPYQIKGLVRDVSNQPLPGVRVETQGRKKAIQVLTNSSGSYELRLFPSDIDGTDLSLDFTKEGYEPEQRILDLRQRTLNRGVYLRPLPAIAPPPEEKKRISGQVMTTYKPRKTTTGVEVRLTAPRDLFVTHTNEKGSFQIERPSRFFDKKDTIRLHFKQRDFQEIEKQLLYDDLDNDRQMPIVLERKPYFDNLSPDDFSLTLGYAGSVMGIANDNLLRNPFLRVSFEHFFTKRLSVGASYTHAGLAYQIPRVTQVSPDNKPQVVPYPVSKPQRNASVQARVHLRPYNTIRWNYFAGASQSVFDWNNSQAFVGARRPFLSELLALDVQVVFANHRDVPVVQRDLAASGSKRGTFNYWGNDTGSQTEITQIKTFNCFYLCASLHVMIPGL